MPLSAAAAGPLRGLRVVEFAGIGPAPHCAMLLSDMGAEVVRIDRPGGSGAANPVHDRGRAHCTLDLRADDGRAAALDVLTYADVLIEGFRPGVMERLGLGPDVALAANPRLIYSRMTGWGQDGPLARMAGHDITYIALTGALHAIGDADRPATPPLNLLGDFGGGSMFLAFGIVAALYERERSGRGQVIDAAVVDGVNHLMAMFAGLRGRIDLGRGRNLLGGAAPFYRVYRCADGEEIAVGALEPQFYAELLDRIGAPDDLRAGQYDAATWPERTATLAALFALRSAAEWRALLEGTDACAAPVLSLDDAPTHPHLAARGCFVEADSLTQAAPAPRFSRTPGAVQQTQDGLAVLQRWRTEARMPP